MKRPLLLTFASLASLVAAEPCIPVMGEWITAKDLGQIEPAFLSLDADAQILRSPRFGVQRHVAAGELAQLASRWNVPPGGARGGCFEHPRKVLEEREIRQAIVDSLTACGYPSTESRPVEVAILEWPREPLPAGRLSFDLKPKRFPVGSTDDASDWISGELKFQVARKLPVWVRVRLRSAQEMFVAASDLSRGTVLRGEHLKKEVRRVNPLPLIRSTGKPLPVAESVIGRRLISDLAAGAVLNASHLEPAGSIRKGEQVALHVVSGSARIRLAATAENAGAMGDRIVLRIDGTSKRVAAEVTASGAARIELRTTAREGSEED